MSEEHKFTSTEIKIFSKSIIKKGDCN